MYFFVARKNEGKSEATEDLLTRMQIRMQIRPLEPKQRMQIRMQTERSMENENGAF